MTDVIIVGSGPAGLSAALTLKQLNISFIWFGDSSLSSKIAQAPKIKNYPGLIDINGQDLKEAFLRQIDKANIVIENKIVTGVYKIKDYYSVIAGDMTYDAKCVLITTGVQSIKNIEGELDLVGSGVSYCATCDGMLYKAKDIAVISYDDKYDHEIEFLAEIANSITLFTKSTKVKKNNITVINEYPNKINRTLSSVNLSLGDDVYSVKGVFILKDSIAPNILVPGVKIENGHILVDRSCNTNMAGLFAAGDITGRPYQYAKAVGEGNVAAHSIFAYLKRQ